MKIGDLTVKQFQQLSEILNDTTIEPIDRECQIIALVENRPVEEVESMNLVELKNRVKHYSNFDVLDLDKEKLPKFVIINKKLYDVCLSERDMSAGQFVDMCHYIKDSKGAIANMHHIFTVMLRRRKWLIKKEYDGTNHDEVAEYVKEHMPIRAVYPLALFFYNYMKASLSVIENYLALEKKRMTERWEAEQKKAKDKHKKHLKSGGVGISH